MSMDKGFVHKFYKVADFKISVQDLDVTATWTGVEREGKNAQFKAGTEMLRGSYTRAEQWRPATNH